MNSFMSIGPPNLRYRKLFVARLLFMLNGSKLISGWYGTRRIFTQQPYTVGQLKFRAYSQGEKPGTPDGGTFAFHK